MSIRTASLLLILFINTCFSFVSCKKTSVEDNSPVIETIFPTYGRYHSLLMIKGHHFSGDPSIDQVKINGIPATINTPGKDTIFVYVPLNCGSGPVTINVNGKTAKGPDFNYIAGGTVTTIAGNGIGDGQNGASTIAPLNLPNSVAVDKFGNVFVSENNRIKKISINGSLSVYAGDGWFDYKDTLAAYARFFQPHGLAVDQFGNLFVADQGNNCIRKITPDGIVSTYAGNKTSGYIDGPALTARFWGPNGLAIDAADNMYVMDEGNKRVRKILADGTVSTLAGSGKTGHEDGIGILANFYDAKNLAVDPQGNVFVAEELGHRVRKITPDGTVTTFAGSPFNSYHDDIGTKADFSNLTGIATDATGNIYVSDFSNALIRKISPQAVVTTVAGTPVKSGFADGPAETAKFGWPAGLATDAAGNIYVADFNNHRVRKITLP